MTVDEAQCLLFINNNIYLHRITIHYITNRVTGYISHTYEVEKIKGIQTINIYTIQNYFTHMYSVSYEDKKVICHESQLYY